MFEMTRSMKQKMWLILSIQVRINIIEITVSDKIVTKITVKFFIQYIKTGTHTIALSSLDNLSILSFPSLKTVYSGDAGNGLRIVFDVSLRGLIFAHDTATKGQLVIHNLTGSHSKIKQRKDTVSSILTQSARQNSKRQKINSLQNDQRRKFTIKQAFPSKQQISCIKVSPFGGRVAVASIKGSSIKVFVTNSGELLQQMRVSYQICKIFDFAFDQQGLFLACITQGMRAYVFNCKIDQQDEIFYKKKYRSHVYQQENPSSSLWFLSPFYSAFGNDQPFSDFTLEPPQEKQLDKVENKIQQKDPLSIILEDPSTNPIQAQLLKRNLQANDLIIPQQSQNYSVKQRQELKQRSSSFADSSLRGTLIKQKRSTLNQEENQGQQYVPTVYNTVNRIHIGKNSQVWAVRGYFLYAVQYDRFNGGAMEHSRTMAIQ